MPLNDKYFLLQTKKPRWALPVGIARPRIKIDAVRETRGVRWFKVTNEAAINGHAIAGGCVLACCADRQIMMRGGGRMGITELLVSVPFPALAFEIVRFAVPGRYLPEFTIPAQPMMSTLRWRAAGSMS